MNAIQIVIISLALILITLGDYLNDGQVMQQEEFSGKIRFILIAFFFQVLMLGTGVWLGHWFNGLAGNAGYFITLGILLGSGIKVIFNSLRPKTETKEFTPGNWRSAFPVFLSEGSTPMVIAFGVGLVTEIILLPWIIMSCALLLSMTGGIFAGSRSGEGAMKYKTATAGGLIILAAALKILIDLIGY